MKRLIPRVVKVEYWGGDRPWMLGVETWVTEHERHLPYTSFVESAERFVMLHLGHVALEWKWGVRA
ncbi:hypothetical protein [Microcella frigidaquae]|uniref:Uncharacterized protein n=1 Tax=Microcella frigidaquae TaxID=424758 RepID=A0A840X7P4_9MICO|nr:hypothetical protein [Microcella frigidaquae]MBB5617224.1 hypothetical protein [Microcella frigidaquae]NHN45075.1 hypothetical protein [Microcella frigidaquae]